MTPQLAIVLVYLLAMLAIGIVFRRRSARDTVEFFLAGRGIGRLVLFFTMAATNFSAFTIFGVSGAGYRIGYAFYPVMGFGTGFMALGLWVIGSRVHALGRERGYVTPSDFIRDRYGSPLLKGLFSIMMILFTLPYISIQAIAAGRSLEALAGLPYWAGALLVMGFTVCYVMLGGMRSVAWTDLVQALMILGFTLAGFILIAVRVGGLAGSARELAARYPGLFARPGLDGSLTPGVWLGYLLLWLFADPMFPQLFQRFLAARDLRSLKTTVVLYPLITTFLFFLTVSIGVLGRAVFPDLSPAQSESVYPLLLARFASPFLSTLLLTGGLAALMSTLDSQLLTMASMIGLDFGKRKAAPVWLHRLIVLAIGFAGYLLALRPPQTILDFVNRTSFTGLAVLAPVVLGGLYWPRANRYGALAGILAGEAMTVLSSPAMVGSGVWAGKLDRDWAYARKDFHGKKIGEELERIGYRGQAPAKQWPVHAYFEFHIEQGPILERVGKRIGVPQGIVGISWYDVFVEGKANQVGPTPMEGRNDALCAAAEMILQVESLPAQMGGNMVATVGEIHNYPNSRNIIPGQVHFTVDLRSWDDPLADRAGEELHNGFRKIATKRGCPARIEKVWKVEHTPFDKSLVNQVGKIAEQLGYPSYSLVSGAGHDATYLSQVAPTAMIFVPSIGGRSHVEVENTRWEDCEAGGNVLLHCILQSAL